MSILFAATYPERTLALVLYGGFARHWTLDPKTTETYIRYLADAWAAGTLADRFIPSSARGDAARHEWWLRFQRDTYLDERRDEGLI